MTTKRKAMVLMALVLAVATAATAATAFAGSKKNHRFLIEQQVANSVHITSQAMLQLELRAMPRVRHTTSRLPIPGRKK